MSYKNLSFLINFIIASFLLSTLTMPGFSLVARPVIAVIKSREIKPYNDAFDGVSKAFKDNGIKVSFVHYDIKGNREEGLKAVESISAIRPRIVITIGTLATEIAKERFKETPVLFCMVLNPVANGLIKSIECSGNNLTGASMDISSKYQFETLRRIIPNLGTIGVIYNPKETSQIISEAENVATEIDLKLNTSSVNSENEIPDAIKDLGKTNIDCLWSVSDSTVFNSFKSIQFIILYCLRNKIPFMGISSSFVKSGALLAISCDSEDNGYQSGELAIQLLNGKKPSELPITVPRKTYLSINLKIADILGLKIPPDVISTAKETFQ